MILDTEVFHINWHYYKIEKILNIENIISTFKTEFKKDFVFSGEMHNFWEMFYVLDGSVCVSADEKIYNLEKNQIIFHKPMELHKFHINSTASVFVISFTLSGEKEQHFNNLTLNLSAEQREILITLISILEKNQDENKDYYNRFLKGFHNNPLLIQQTQCILEYFLLTLCENKTDFSLSDDSFSAETFKNSVLLMEEHITDWVTLPQIANHLNISVSYLKKIFAKYTGMGVHKYFLKTKMVYACKMLKKGKNVNEIAETLNFSSPNYFSSVFKREIGVSPIAFRNEKHPEL